MPAKLGNDAAVPQHSIEPEIQSLKYPVYVHKIKLFSISLQFMCNLYIESIVEVSHALVVDKVRAAYLSGRNMTKKKMRTIPTGFVLNVSCTHCLNSRIVRIF